MRSIKLAVLAALTVVVGATAFTGPANAIIGGGTPSSTSWPWAVQVLIDESSLCGGTLVAPQRVLTGGACVGEASPGQVLVLANTQELGGEGDAISVTSIDFPPGREPFEPNDLALLTLETAPSPATPIEVLGEEETADFPTPASALVAGWGATSGSGSGTDPSEFLKQGTVTLEGDCGGAGFRCSTAPSQPCFGDLGDPVVVQLGTDTVSKDPSPENGTWRLVATPIFGTEECTETFYSDLTEPSLRAFVESAPNGPPDGAGPGSNPPPAPPLAAPQTKILKAKIKGAKGKATFKFAAPRATGFECSLTSGKRRKASFKPCRSPKTYKGLAPGRFKFKVRATGPGGTDQTPAARGFRIPPA